MLKIKKESIPEDSRGRFYHFLYYFIGKEKSIFDDKEEFFLLDENPLCEGTLSAFKEWLVQNHILFEISGEGASEKTKYLLPITGRSDITLFQNHALLMQVPLVNEYTYPWYYCNFINIFYYKLCYYEYTDHINFYEKPSCYSRIQFRDIQQFNHMDRFIDTIDQNRYIYFWADKYDVEGTNAYQRWHDIHPILIHGYDRAAATYDCSFFEIRSGLHTMSLPMKSLHHALESACFYGIDLTDRPVAYIIKPGLFYNEYDYFVQRFLDELYHYITGTGRRDELYFTIGSQVPYERVVFGIDVTQELIEGLMNHDTAPFDYRLIHMVVENKKLIAERLRYFNITICNRQLESYVEEFQRITALYEGIRMKYMKFSFAENQMQTFYPAPVHPDAVRILCEKIAYALSEERNLLEVLYPQILLCLAENNLFGSSSILQESKHKRDLDQDMLIGSIDMETAENIDYIKVQTFGNDVEGTLQISGSEGITQKIKGTYRSYEFFMPSAKIQNITYRLKRFSLDAYRQPIYICAFRNHLRSHLRAVFCSSVYSGRADLSFRPEDTLTFDKETFWCPEIEDQERFILYALEDTVSVNRLTILQHEGAIRIRKFCVMYSLDNVQWRLAVQVEAEIGKKAFVKTFPSVAGRYFKLTIEQTKRDELGYDLPNISFFDLS